MLCNSWNTHEGDLHRIDALADSGVEGIIYCMSDDTTVEQAGESKTKLQQYGIPVCRGGQQLYRKLYSL